MPAATEGARGIRTPVRGARRTNRGQIPRRKHHDDARRRLVPGL
jgi:hypothetical protein